MVKDTQRQTVEVSVEQIVYRNERIFKYRLKSSFILEQLMVLLANCGPIEIFKMLPRIYQVNRTISFHYRRTEAAEERIPEMAQCKCKILVEKVSEKFTHPRIKQ